MIIKTKKYDFYGFNNFRLYLKNLKFKKYISWAVKLFLLSCFGISCMYYGMQFSQSGKAGRINDALHNILVKQLFFIPNYFNGLFSKPNRVNIDIKFTNFQKLRYYREKSLKLGYVIQEGKDDRISAALTYNNESYNVALSLTGTTLKHIGDPEKWSFRVKVKGNNTVLGMKEFNLLYPRSRYYLTDWIGHMLEQKMGLIALRSDFVDVTINGKHLGIYAIEEHFEKRLIENNSRREGIIFKLGPHLQIYNLKKIESNPKLEVQLSLLRELWQAYLIDEIPASKLFDSNKMAKFYAITDLLNGRHAIQTRNTRYYFNPITSLIEPIGREWNPLRYATQSDKHSIMKLTFEIEEGVFTEYFHSRLYRDYTFMTNYIRELDNLSRPEFLDLFFDEIDTEMRNNLNVIYKDDPFYIYPTEFLYDNQRYIRSKLYPTTPLIGVYYQGREDNKIELLVRNIDNMPIEIKHVSYKNTLLYNIAQENIVEIMENSNTGIPRYIKIQIPDSNSISDKIISQLKVKYRIIGINADLETNVLPLSYPKGSYLSLNPTQNETNIQEFNFLSIDEKNKKIIFKSGKYNCAKSLFIPDGYEVIANFGLELNLINSSRILSYSPIKFTGSQEIPIKIFTSDSTGQGLVVMDANKMSYLEYVHFENLTNSSQGGWELTGAVTFYNSPVKITQCKFIKNRSEDALNIINSNYDIISTNFSNNYFDSFDSDFSNGTINNSSFINCGNDAIDISGSFLDAQDILIQTIGDKGISVGERSQMNGENININDSKIAVASKDKSKVNLKYLNINNCLIGVSAYQKKPEFGSSSIDLTFAKIENTDIPFLIEEESKLTVEGDIYQIMEQNVADIINMLDK